MPTSRTVMLLIKAQNATGEALKAVQGDMNKVAETATKMGEKTEKGFMQGIRGAMSFVRQIRGIYFIIAGLVVATIFKLAEPINEYNRALLKIQDTTNIAGKDIAKLAEIFKEQGIGIGLGTLALTNSTRDVTEASSAYISIQSSLKSMYEKLMPAMEKQEEVLSRIGVGVNKLYSAMGNKDPLAFWDTFHGKITNLKDAFILFGDKFMEAMEILGKTREEIARQKEIMGEASIKTKEAEERMKDYNQAVRDASAAWLDFQATIGPGLLKIKTSIISFLPDLARAINKLPQAMEEIFNPDIARKRKEIATAASAMPKPEFVGPPAPGTVAGVLPPEAFMPQPLPAPSVSPISLGRATGLTSGMRDFLVEEAKQKEAEALLGYMTAAMPPKEGEDPTEKLRKIKEWFDNQSEFNFKLVNGIGELVTIATKDISALKSQLNALLAKGTMASVSGQSQQGGIN